MHSTRSRTSRARRRDLLRCAVTVGVFLVVQYFAVQTATGQFVDDAIMHAVRDLPAKIGDLAGAALDTVALLPLAAAVGLVAVVAVASRRNRPLLRAGIVCLGANASTQVIKHPLIERPLLDPSLIATPNSFPSGHATVAVSLVAAALIALPAPAAKVAALPTALWAAVVAVSTVVAGWHRPSDIIGAALIVLAWVQATRALSRRTAAPMPAAAAAIPASAPAPASAPTPSSSDERGRVYHR